jgi:hypothetical protein
MSSNPISVVMPVKTGIQYAAVLATESLRLWNTGSPPSGMTLRMRDEIYRLDL